MKVHWMERGAVRVLGLTLAIAALSSAAALGAAKRPKIVYPGGRTTVAIEDRCPAFIWSQVPEATGYELAVYELREEGREPELLLEHRLPPGSGSWMPAGSACLHAAARYAWVARALYSDGPGGWSEMALFEITAPDATDVSRALDVLRRYLDGTSRSEPEASANRFDLADGWTADARTPPPSAASHPSATGRSGHRIANDTSPALTDALVRSLWDPIIIPVHTGLRSVESSVGLSTGVYGQSDSSLGQGVFGSATAAEGTTAGVFGNSRSTAGRGVVGQATATTGITYGVVGSSKSSDGAGVLGINQADESAGYGVRGESAAQNGEAIYGLATSTIGSGIGVSGVSKAEVGTGVYGEATTTVAAGYGVWGITRSGSNGHGVFGESTATSGYTSGVFGFAASPDGAGVLGANSSSTGMAGFFDGKVKIDGDLEVTGSVAKGGGSFKIDHPLDPANRYLSHSFVESPGMMNVYNGNVVLDAQGTAWVELPEWFQALNRDFRYQLTALDRPGPGLYVAHRVADNRFRIAGGAPGAQVSWQVTGIRHDPYAKAHPIAVEEDKGALRGSYLHPELYGEPPSKSGEHRERPTG